LFEQIERWVLGPVKGSIMKTIHKMLFVAITLGGMVAQQNATAEKTESTARVTGIGGVFILSRGDGKSLSSWYEKHLGIRIEDFGAAILQWENDTAEDKGITIWGAADRDSDWFSPSKSTFMINYRVNDLEAMVEQLSNAGIDILQGPEYHENGVFAWIMDPDGNKIELWEPKIWDDKNKR
jgi:predicted enzyme related to lactoylglutathione lyase